MSSVSKRGEGKDAADGGHEDLFALACTAGAGPGSRSHARRYHAKTPAAARNAAAFAPSAPRHAEIQDDRDQKHERPSDWHRHLGGGGRLEPLKPLDEADDDREDEPG